MFSFNKAVIKKTQTNEQGVFYFRDVFKFNFNNFIFVS